jgi:hypothetical protein
LYESVLSGFTIDQSAMAFVESFMNGLSASYATLPVMVRVAPMLEERASELAGVDELKDTFSTSSVSSATSAMVILYISEPSFFLFYSQN